MDSLSVAYGGTWERVEGRFLWARESAQEVGTTGGLKTVALTVAQMPAHSHTVNSHTHTTPNHTHTWANENTTWSGNQVLNSSRIVMAAVKKSGQQGFQGLTGSGFYRDWAKTTAWMVSSGGGTSGAAAPATNSVGSGSGHENMPPFIATNCWHRTA